MNAQRGFTLVELMVALVLSVLVSAGVLQVYMTSSQHYRAQESAALMMENGRTAIEILSRDLRLANYWKCIGWDPENLSNDLSSNQRGLFGTNGANGAPDELRMLHALDETAVAVTAEVKPTFVDTTTIPNTVTLNDIPVSDGSGFAVNDIIVINDCAKGDVFQLTAVNANALSHECEGCAETYGTDAWVLLVEDTQYSVANNDRGEPALYRSVNGAAAEELLEGVESMQLFFGEDTDSDGFANRYVTAEVINAPCADNTNPGCWNRVTSVRISLLLRTLEEDVTLGPQTYNYNGAAVTATDGRLRRVFTTVVAMRNHLE
jgi:type IV pilus assembly protein PilW